MTTSLPDKPSELILLALEDLEKTEKDGRYRIDMRVYHALMDPGMVCSVCLAGAVIAQRLAPDCDDLILTPLDFGGVNERKLEALNEFRMGSVEDGLLSMCCADTDVEFHDRFIVPYEDDPAAFKSDMRELARELSDRGL